MAMVPPVDAPMATSWWVRAASGASGFTSSSVAAAVSLWRDTLAADFTFSTSSAPMSPILYAAPSGLHTTSTAPMVMAWMARRLPAGVSDDTMITGSG